MTLPPSHVELADPIKAVCRRDFYPAYRQSGTRPVSAIKWIVLHSAEARTADSVARYFQSRSARGSTHLVVDDVKCQRCLSDATIPWGATGANYAGVHIEQCGFARWAEAMWVRHSDTLERAAFKTALHAVRFGIPVVFVEARDLRAGRPGITTHVECALAFGGTHWDPGPGWPRSLFMRLVRGYARELFLTRIEHLA